MTAQRRGSSDASCGPARRARRWWGRIDVTGPPPRPLPLRGRGEGRGEASWHRRLHRLVPAPHEQQRSRRARHEARLLARVLGVQLHRLARRQPVGVRRAGRVVAGDEDRRRVERRRLKAKTPRRRGGGASPGGGTQSRADRIDLARRRRRCRRNEAPRGPRAPKRAPPSTRRRRDRPGRGPPWPRRRCREKSPRRSRSCSPATSLSPRPSRPTRRPPPSRAVRRA